MGVRDRGHTRAGQQRLQPRIHLESGITTREAAVADPQRFITILSVYSSHSKDRPRRPIGWEQVRTVHSHFLTGKLCSPFSSLLAFVNGVCSGPEGTPGVGGRSQTVAERLFCWLLHLWRMRPRAFLFFYSSPSRNTPLLSSVLHICHYEDGFM